MPETRMVVKLKATSAVTDLIGAGELCRLRKHQRKTAWEDNDAITYQRISTEPVNHATGTTSTAFARIQLDLWSSTPAGIRDLAAAVRGALSGWSDEAGSPAVSMCHLINEMDMPEGPESGDETAEQRIMQEYLIQYS